MPNLNEFLKKFNAEITTLDANTEIIEQMRPCSKCDLYVDSNQFNSQTLEMYRQCKDGHETRYSVS